MSAYSHTYVASTTHCADQSANQASSHRSVIHHTMSDRILSSVTAVSTGEDGAKRRRIDKADPTNTSSPGPPPSSPSPVTAQCLFPAEVLAHILNYMLYGDVRKILLAGRIMAFEAARKVSALNITLANQINIRAAKNRFPNVEEINVFSLDREVVDGNDASNITYSFSIQTVSTIVFFLQSFPCLKRAWIGGVGTAKEPFRKGYFSAYNFTTQYVQNEDAQEIMKGLVLSFCGAFRSGTLSQELELGGILHLPLDHECDMSFTYKCEDTETPGCFETCMLCQEVCKTFPVKIILNHLVNSNFVEDYCFLKSRKKVTDIIANRQGGLEYLASEEFLKRLIRQQHYLISVVNFPVVPAGYRGKLEAKPLTPEYIYIDSTILDFIEHIAKKYIIRWTFPEDFFTGVFTKCICKAGEYLDRGFRLLLDKKTYDVLTSAGIYVDLNVFAVVGCKADFDILLEE